MCASGIFLYCTRAAVFAAAVCALWALWYALRGRKKAPLGRRALWLRLLWLFYLAALVQITVLRSGREACSFWLRAQRGIRMNLRPFFTIRLEWRAGLWPFCYNVFGNIGWFMPFGLLGPAVRPRLRGFWCAVFSGALLSTAIELGQFALASGSVDVDDILLNTLGALLGWLLWRGIRAVRQKSRSRRAAE